MTHYILVTGYRKWPFRSAVVDRLNSLYSLHKGDVMVIHGDCPTKRYGWMSEGESVDAIAKEWAMVNEVPYLSFPARWLVFRSAAGPIRNEKMVKWLYEILRASSSGVHVYEDINHDAYTCLAFVHPESVGTLDCIKKLDSYGLKYTRVTPEDD